MKRTLLLILSLFLLTARAEEINSPLVHAEELPLAVDISPVIRFETDETGVFAVVTVEPLAASAPLSSSEELMVELEDEEEEPPAFLVTSSFTAQSITYTLTPISTEGEPN